MIGEDSVGSLIRGYGTDPERGGGVLATDKHQVFGLMLLQRDGTGEGITYHSILRWPVISDRTMVFLFQHEYGIGKVTLSGENLLSKPGDAEGQHKPPGRMLIEGKQIILRVGDAGITAIDIEHPEPPEDM